MRRKREEPAVPNDSVGTLPPDPASRTIRGASVQLAHKGRPVIPKTVKTPGVKVHTTAVVADGAVLAEGVEIGPYCVIGPRAHLGHNCRLHSHVVIQGDTSLGADCELFPFAVLGTRPQDKKLRPEDASGALRIGSDNVIREHVTIHGGTAPGPGVTTIGDHNMFLAACHIGHDAKIGNEVVFTNAAMAAGHTVVGDRTVLGAMVGIHQFARVGALAMIGAGAMLSHDAPPFALPSMFARIGSLSAAWAPDL